MIEYQFIRDDDGIIRSVQRVQDGTIIHFVDPATGLTNTSHEYTTYIEWLQQDNIPVYPE